MKSYNKKLLTISILVLCVACFGFVGAVSAEGLTVTADKESINTGDTVNFTIKEGYDSVNYTYGASATVGGVSFTLSTSSLESNSFTQRFDTDGSYTVTVVGTNKNESITEKISGTATVTVKKPETTYTPTISDFVADHTTGTSPLVVNFTFTCTNATNIQLLNEERSIEDKVFPVSSITHEFTSGEYHIRLHAANGTNSVSSTNTIIIKVEDKATIENITEINLKIVEPAIGATPATQVTCTGGVKFEDIKWSTDENFGTYLNPTTPFDADKIYYARVTLTNDTNYRFGTDIPTIKINNGIPTDKKYLTAKFEGQKLIVDVKCFDKTSAEISSVSATITAPVTGNTPDTNPTSGNEKTYSVYKTEWYESGSSTPLNTSAKFEANTAYTVNITLEAVDPNTKVFDSALNASNATINGKTVSDLKYNSNKEIVISYTFPKTTKLAGPAITFSINPTKPKIPSNANTVTVTYSYTITGNPTSATLFFGEGAEIDLGTATNGIITGTKTHDFNYLGSFQAYVTAKNANDVSTERISFSVGQEALAAILEAGPLTGVAPLSVTFNDKSTGTVTSRTWNFGDGSVASHEASTSHTYTSPGTYVVTLTVTDGRSTDSATKTITVTEAKKEDTKTEEEPKEPVNYEPLITIGDLEIPSPVDLISEFVRLFQSLFDFDNYHIFSNETTEDE